jgi:hypothetical protein
MIEAIDRGFSLHLRQEKPPLSRNRKSARILRPRLHGRLVDSMNLDRTKIAAISATFGVVNPRKGYREMPSETPLVRLNGRAAPPARALP